MLATLLASFAPALSQNVVVVDENGGADFTTIKDAVSLASAGSIVLVRSGTYGRFRINGKSLSVVAEDGANVVCRDAEVNDLGVDDTVVLDSLIFVSSGNDTDVLGDANSALQVTNCAGAVVVQESTVLGAVPPYSALFGTSALVVRDSASVFVVDSTLSGGASEGFSSTFAGAGTPALECVDSTVHVFGGSITGGTGQASLLFLLDGGAEGGAGAVVTGSDLFLAGVELRGGSGGDGAGSSVVGGPCNDGGDGGVGLVAGASSVERRGGSLDGGPGGAAGDIGCATGASGPALSLDLTSLAESDDFPPTLVATPNPVREGASAELRFGGEPGDLVVWIVDFTAATAPLLDLGGPVLLPLSAVISFVGPVPASSELVLPIVVPDLIASLEGLRLVQQSIHVAPDGALEASNPIGAIYLDGGL